MAAKSGRQPPTPAAAGASIGAPARAADLLATALRYHQAGQLAEAEGLYRKILAIDGHHIDSLHLLGLIAHQVGRNDMAVDLIGKAIALNDRNPAFHNNIALAFDALGRAENAVVHYERAIILKPNYVEAHNNLGAAFQAQGKMDAAVAQYRWALALKPDFAEAHNNLGNALKEQGELAEAVASYQRALAAKPTFAEAHNNLGNALKTQGKLVEAVALHQQALELKPSYAVAHYNLGNALKEQGKLDAAVASYQRAVTLKPDYAEAHNNLGNALQKQGNLDEAVARYQQALALKPDFAEAHNNLGNALQDQGKADEAVAQYRRVLALMPNHAEAHNNLGAAFHDQGKVADAVAQYRRVLALNPDYAEAHGNLGKALMEGGDLAQALKAIQRSIEIGQTENTKLLFVECVRNLNVIPREVDLRENLISALSEPWGRPVDLARFSADLLKLDGATSACIDRVTRAWPRLLPAQQIFSPTEFAEVCDNRLFRCLLESTPVCDPGLERFLTATRSTMLDAASAGIDSQPVEDNALRFYCALAQQCFINEYIFSCTDRDIELAGRLREQLVEALASGTAIPELLLVAVAAFFPLAGLPAADLILERRWSAPVAALVARQVREGQEERDLQTSVPRLTAIKDGVSLLVRQQYEENPYPRWVKAAPVGKSTTIDGYLRRQFPLVLLRNTGKTSRAEILVAGCGTGQHSIETARRFAGAQVLAVDLSLSSLCYAKRKTRELGLSNIEYAQADILQLDSIGRAFDLIEASGVLHHLADPMAGWRLLLSMLRPGGFMRVGLYSKMARQDLVDARKLIAERGYGASAEDIRRCRQDLAGFGDGTALGRVTEFSDFFSTSACRDLLFHVQEHQMTLPEISPFLRQNRLELLGFALPGHVLQNFRRRFPNDKTMTDLDLWHIFETENPSTFAGMYQFWVQKT
jgi:tetratricopeptide (TPR) repeat protein/2-polyprenyl-3-methyl-5-hydroxy-6-metoxy-1,4-benzoquinol methylase